MTHVSVLKQPTCFYSVGVDLYSVQLETDRLLDYVKILSS